MIVKTKKGYVIKSADGKKTLSKPYKTRKEAEKRLKTIEFYKNKQKKRKK